MDSADDGAAIGGIARPGYDFQRIWQEAKSRWLRPKEVYDILHNHFNFPICTEPPNLPPSGTLILFDRKMLRNFRRDGHPWRKKKDNKTVKEAHEHLKVGSEEKVHVYYAHGEGDSTLQRRVYWLLDKNLEHIVLVHYLEVKEGNRLNAQQPWQRSSLEGMRLQQDPMLELLPSRFLPTAMTPVQSSGSSEVLTSTQHLEFSDFNSHDDFDTFSLEELQSSKEMNMGMPNVAVDTQWLPHAVNLTNQSQVQGLGDRFTKQNVPTIAYTRGNLPAISDMAAQSTHVFGTRMGKADMDTTSDDEESNFDAMNISSWSNLLVSNNTEGRQSSNYNTQLLNTLQMPALTDSNAQQNFGGTLMEIQDSFESQGMVSQTGCLPPSLAKSGQTQVISCDKTDESMQQWGQNADNSSKMTWPGNYQNIQFPVFESQSDDGDEVLKKLDSLDRWMQRELPAENKGSPLAVSVNSCCYLDTVMHEQSQNKAGDVLNPAWKVQLSDELTPSFPPKLFFDITDFSPNWSFSSEEIKIIVAGHFTGDPHDFDNIHWCCMFGDIEVPAEIVQPGVLRCKSPKAGPGQVRFCITDGNKQACSDFKDFEFRHNTESQKELDHSKPDKFIDDEMLQIRLAQLLLGKFENRTKLLQKIMISLEEDMVSIEKLMAEPYFDPSEVKEQILLMFIKQKLVDWVLDKSKKDKKGFHSFDKLGQGVLHLASALGYEWIINVMMASGISIDLRDRKGWTALHWAANFGREKMIAALLAAGAKAGAASDPTPEFPSGCYPADVAASAGYDGIAGYLSVCGLTTHVDTLTLSENEHDKHSAREQGHRAVEYLRRSPSLRKSVRTYEDELCLEDSLCAVNDATVAASRIHAAFREFSFKERLHAIEEVDEYGLTSEERRALFAAQKIQKAYRKHREQKVKDSAALQIQNRYRGWKSRKDYLGLRQKVIKIQAYFRMHQARKQYHKILWSVGVLEKALLRWRQKKKGLRGFQADVAPSNEGLDSDDFLKIGRKQAEENFDRALVRVQAMVRSRLARQQYRRMLENANQAKLADQGSMEIF